MASVGGSVKAFTVDSRPFSVAADADVTLRIGGTKVTVAINGDGTPRYLGEVEGWSLSGIDAAIDNNRDDLGFFQRIANAMAEVPCTITLIDGTVFQGKGIVADDHNYSTAKATAGMSLMGGGQLTPQ